MTVNRPYLVSSVRYGDPLVIQTLINSLNAQSARRHVSIAVADNGPGSDSSLKTCLISGDVDFLVPHPENQGYFPSVFSAAKLLASRRTDIDWIFLINSDVSFDLECAFRELQSFDPTFPTVVCPQILDGPSLRRMNPHLTEPISAWRHFLMAIFWSNTLTARFWLFIHKSRVRNRKSIRPEISDSQEAMNIYSGYGAFYALTKPAFEILVDHSTEACLYTEEVWLGEVCKAFSIPVIYKRTWVVDHSKAHATTGQMELRQRVAVMRRAAFRMLKWRLFGGAHD